MSVTLFRPFKVISSILMVIGDGQARTTLTGVTVGVDVSGREKILRTVQAIGDIAFAYAYSTILIEIEVKKKLINFNFTFQENALFIAN